MPLSVAVLLTAAGCSEPEAQVAARSAPAAKKRQVPPQKTAKAGPSLQSGAADQEKSIDSKSQPLDLTIPDGSAKQLLDFLIKLDQVRLEEDTPQAVAEFVKVQKTIIEGAEQLLAKSDLEEKTRVTALQLKWGTLGVLMTLDEPGAEERFLEFAKELVGDRNETISRVARLQLRQVDIDRAISGLLRGSVKSTDKLMQDLGAILGEEGLRYGQFKLVREAARVLEAVGKYDEAAKLYTAFEEAFKKSGEPDLAEAAGEVGGKAKTRLGWIGKEAELKGKTRDGHEFDLSEYKGKVVLVDFWATWCGPCLEELPNVIENYKKFHDRGFEVVGISLDSDHERLDTFFKENELPWPVLWTAEIAEKIVDDPFEHPLAKKYGVDALPSTFLVDQQGKVIKLGVSGKRLGEKLGELLGEPDEPEKKSGAN